MFEAIRKFLGFGTKPNIFYPFHSLTNALKEKDAELYNKLKHLSADQAWREWKKVYPEDFPLDGDSPIDARSIKPKGR